MRVKLIGRGLLSLVPAVFVAAAAAAQNSGGNIEEARALVKAYAENLKKELKSALESEGAAQAIEVCHLKAPDIATEMSQQSGWTVRRTSLKVRILEDAPDKWEYKILKDFEQREEAGEDPGKMEYAEVTEKEGKRYFRYMKAIPTRQICLKCHGEEIRPEVKKQLDSLYPYDQAVGFSVGDIRGAFSLAKPLEE